MSKCLSAGTFLVLCGLLAGSPAGSAPGVEAAAQTPVAEKRRIKTIIVDNYQPYTFLNERGEPDGFSVEIIRAVAEALGQELEIRTETWDHAMQALESGAIDVLPMMAYSAERDRLFDFSAPHTIAFDSVFVKKGNERLRTLTDLSGRTVVVMNRDAAHEYLVAHDFGKRINLLLTNSLPDALRLLAAGKADAAIMPKLVGLVLVKNLGLAPIVQTSAGITAYNRPFSFAVKEGNNLLLERLVYGLSVIKTTGQYDKIYKKWFAVLEDPQIRWKTALEYALAMAAACLALVVWSLLLRQQVRSRTRRLEAEMAQRALAEKSLRGSEEKYRQLAGELEQRVGERTLQLEAANRELEAFAYSVSHDLRAPLRAIEGFSTMVTEEYGARLDAEGQRQLGVIRANATKMSGLIDDLLAFSRTGRSEMQGGRVAMGELSRSVFAEVVADPAARAKIGFTVGDLPDAEGDAALLRQVWFNLLSNAVKFSAKQEHPLVEITGAVSVGEVVYHVRDNGAGFDMRYNDKLFGVFQRLHAADQFEGTGIGLALVQRIVNRHGGRVWAEGAVGRGATFSFALPAPPAAGPATKPQPASTPR